MTDNVSSTPPVNVQLALQAWLSPAYPVGAYAYSHGLEAAVEAASVHDSGSLLQWVQDNLQYGSGWNDAIFMHETARIITQDSAQDTISALTDLAQLAAASCVTAELQQEMVQQGASFLKVTKVAWPHRQFAAFAAAVKDNPAYSVCFAAVASWHGVDIRSVVTGYLFSMATNWISAAIRLNVIGQTDGQRIAGAIAPLAEKLAEQTMTATRDDLGGCSFLNEIASFHHEAQQARLFRS